MLGLGLAGVYSPLELRLCACSGGNLTGAATKGIVRPNSKLLGGLAHLVVPASVEAALAAVAVAWIAWSPPAVGEADADCRAWRTAEHARS